MQRASGKMRLLGYGLSLGREKSVVNGRESKIYFARPVLQMLLNQPFTAESSGTI